MTFEEGRVWVISEKNISHRLISKENDSCKEIPEEKIPSLKKKSFVPYKSGKIILCLCMSASKNSITRGLGKILTQTKFVGVSLC